MKNISLPFGDKLIEISVSDNTDVLTAGTVMPLADPTADTMASISSPISSKPLSDLAKGKKDAAIVVSDNTRPVPYKNILPPIIKTLGENGINDIKIIVGCGSHLPMSDSQLRKMLPETAFQAGIKIINHIATDESMLRSIGSTDRTPDVTINSHYLDAELKILTGLVEPHFMAGFSGGRKAICPGISGQSVTYGFHSASILNDENATSFVLKNNPCHEEALAIAKMAGADFNVNVTIDGEKNATGVFAGDMEKSHLAAVEHLNTYAKIPLDKLYDIVITPSGFVGLNHYQSAKAAFEAIRALKAGGSIILVADLTDRDAVGGENYKQVLKLMTSLGPQDFLKKILADDWTFIPEQWEVQMWAKVFVQMDNCDNFYTCAPQLEDCDDSLIPEANIASQIKRLPAESNVDYTQRMTQSVIDQLTKKTPDSQMLILPDGPYAGPIFNG